MSWPLVPHVRCDNDAQGGSESEGKNLEDGCFTSDDATSDATERLDGRGVCVVT